MSRESLMRPYGYVVELEAGVYRAPWSGDPGRTTCLQSAKVYRSRRGAQIALGMARTCRPYQEAWIHPVRLSMVEGSP